MNRRYLLVASTFADARQVRVTADRLAAADPSAARTLVATDGDERTVALLAGAGDLLTGADLGLSDDTIGLWAGGYGPEGLLWASFPHVLGQVGETGERVLWLSAELDLSAAPQAFWNALDDAALVGGRAAPSLAPFANDLPDNANGKPHSIQPGSAVVREGGELVSRQMFGWTAGSAELTAALAQWPVPRDRPTHETITSAAVIQTWFNALALSGDATIVGGPDLVLSVAQLLTRTVEPPAAEGDDGRPLIDGAPVTILPTRGFDPLRPYLLEGDVHTARVSDLPALAPVLLRRARALIDAGWPTAPEPSRWATLPGDVPVSPTLRRLIREAARAGALTRSPWTDVGFGELQAYLTQPGSEGAAVGVNRFLAALHADRLDLRSGYPTLSATDGLGFIGWAWVHGTVQDGFPTSFLPPRPAFLDGPPPEDVPRTEPDTEGVNLAGYFTSELGLGESARQIASALEAAGVPTTPVQGLLVPPTRQQAEFRPVTPAEAHHDVNVVVVNGEQMPGFANDVGERFFEGRPTIGVWWWEVDPFPSEVWSPALHWLDEIWVGTDFIRGLIEPHVDVPVWVFPVPVSVTELDPPLPRGHFGFAEDETVFLYVWDYNSTEARKNPSGLVEAYRRAFPDPATSKTRLVLKCINHENVPALDEKVRLAAAGRDDIQFIDRFLSGREKNGLLAICDCYVSPHRSEGFGYTPAEAMLLGKPVVVTGYGGTTQYADETVARVVDWTLAPVGPGASPYPAHGRWAEPDLVDLAAALRWIVDEPQAAAAMAERGRERIRTAHALEASGQAMRDRLATVRARAAATADDAAAAARAAAAEAPDDAPPPPAAAPRPDMKRILKRAAGAAPGAGRVRAALRRRQDRAVTARTADLREGLGRLEVSSDERLRQLAAEVQPLKDATFGVGGQIAGLEALDGRVDELTRKIDDHLLRHSVEPYGIREAGFSVREEPGIGRALGGHDLVSTGDRYADFLSVFRGPYDRVKELMEPYGPLLAGQGPLLDIGCGRGELMEVAEQAGTDGVRGIDLDHELVEQARGRGRNAEAGDGIEALRELADDALGAVTAIHVLEHLDVETLEAFFSQSLRTLRPGGVVIIETINPHEVSAASTFWVDPTHHGPLFPEVALALALSAGFSSAHVFAPDGTGDWDHDRSRSTRYALLARSAAR